MKRLSSFEDFSRYGPIKSVHQGVISWGSSATGTATLSTPVDPENSLIFFNGITNSTLTQNNIGFARIELTNATTVTAYRYYTGSESTSVGYCVIEFTRGVLKRVQRSTAIFDASPKNVTITIVDLTKVIVNHLGWRLNDANAPVTYIQQNLQLTTSTNLQISSGSVGSQELGWQVGEFN